MRTNRLILLAMALGLVTLGQCRGRPAGRKLPPARVPAPPVVEMTGPDQAWPPMPKGATNIKVLPTVEGPASLTDARIAVMKAVALSDANVRSALGARFAYLTADEVEPPKGQPRPTGDQMPGLLHFFSHTSNTAVTVRMAGLTVAGIERRPGLAPPAGAEEIALGIALASKDERLVNSISGLTGYAMVITPQGRRPGVGHRVLYVTFSKPEDDHSKVFADVDLIDLKVLAAGPVEGR